MVWNDAQFRTQQWESDLQLQSDQFRSQSMQQGLGAIQRAGEQYSQNRQANADRQMQGQQFDQQMMLRTAETNARLQLMEQERQENAIKLQALTAVDMAKRSRMETEAMDLHNQQMRLGLKMEEKKLSVFDQDRSTDMLKGFDQNTMAGLASTDWVIDIGPDGSIIPRKDKAAAQQVLENIRNSRIDPAERQAKLELLGAQTQATNELAKARAGQYDTEVQGLQLRAQELAAGQERLAISRAKELIELGDEESIKEAKRILNAAAQSSPAAGAGEPKPTTPTTSSDGGDEERAKSLSAMKARFNIQGIDGKPHYGEQESTWIATALTDHRDAVLSAFKKAVAGDRTYKNDDEAMQDLLMFLRDPYQLDGFGQSVANALMQIGGGK